MLSRLVITFPPRSKQLSVLLFSNVDGKVSAYNAGDLGSIPGSGRSPGEGNSNPLQYSCLENPMDGGAWWAPVHGVSKSQTRLRDFTFTFNVSLITPFLACWLLYVLFSEWPNNNLFWVFLAFLEDYKHWSTVLFKCILRFQTYKFY